MNPVTGWLLAAVLFGVAAAAYGWQGALAAFSAIVFWLLLQFNRSVRLMKRAGEKPVGWIASAVMFNAKLRPGLTLLQVIQLSGSLGRRLARDGRGECWAWTDEGGSRVELEFDARGRLASYRLARPDEPVPAPDAAAGVPPPA